MKINMELPILVKARPKTCRSDVHVYCKTNYTVDIPEVSLSEMDPVFKFHTRHWTMQTFSDKERQDRQEIVKRDMHKPWTMRSMDGKLYRKIANSLEDAQRVNLFKKPFNSMATGRTADNHVRGKHTISWVSDYGGDISRPQIVQGHGPVSNPLATEFEWQIDKLSVTRLLSKATWPSFKFNHPKGTYRWPPNAVLFDQENIQNGDHRHRNFFDLNDPELGITNIDSEELSTAEQMLAKQAGKIVIADGEIWMETKPPVYQLQYLPAVYRNGPSQINLSVVTAPDSVVGNFLVRHYSLLDREAAERDMAEFYGKEEDWGEGYSRVVNDFTGEYSVDSDDILEYDHHQMEVNRIGYMAAVEARAYLERKPNYADKLTEDDRNTIAEAYNRTLDTNFILERHIDMSDLLPELSSAWKKLGYRQFLQAGHSFQWSAKKGIEHALRCIEEAPISVPKNLSSPGTRM